MNRTFELAKAELIKIEFDLECLNNRHRFIKEKVSRWKSIQFISDNNIKAADVEMSADHVMPGESISKFGGWLKTNSKKHWCEFNNRIYLTSEVIDGSVELNGIGRISELDD